MLGNGKIKRNGHGTLTYADGNVYDGEFKDDDMNGRGTFTYADGGVYTGEFKDDLYHGHGTYMLVVTYMMENLKIV